MLYIINGLNDKSINLFMEKKVTELKNENTVFLVPEQCSFQTETDILNIAGEKRANEITVVSFSRLCRLIFEKTGFPQGKRLDDITRNILIHIAFDELKDELKLYSKYSNDIEIINMLKNIFSEFKTCTVSDEDTFSIAEKFNGNELGEKMREISLLYTAYERLVQNGYSDSMDDLDVLYEKLLEYHYFKNKTVFINSFFGFTVQELNIIKLIFSQAKDIYISLPLDKTEIPSQSTLFLPSQQIEKKLIALVKNEGIGIEKQYIDDSTDTNNELELLARHTFRNDGFTSDISPQNIAIFKANDCYDELNRVATEITKFIQSGNYKYRDFAVIVRDEETYNNVIKNIFDKYDIPYFMDRHRKIEDSPLIIFVNALMQIIVNKYRTTDIMRYLKTGLTGIPQQEISLLENYVFVWSTDNEQWLKDFVDNPRGFSSEFTEKDYNRLAMLNELRKKIITPIRALEKQLEKSKTGAEKVKLLYSFLDDIDIITSIKSYTNTLKVLGYDAKAKEELRIWEIFINILEHVYDALDDREVDIIEFAKILNIAFSSQEISFIPQSLDQTYIISIQSRAVCNAKIGFILGANENDFPKNMVNSGLLTDFQREKLINAGLGLTSTLEKLTLEEEFLAYKAVCMPCEKLYVSYVIGTLKSEDKTKSAIVRDILKIFPNLSEQSALPENPLDFIRKPAPAFDFLATNWTDTEHKNVFSALKHYYKTDDNFKDKLLKLGESPTDKDLSFRDSAIANDFFKTRFKLSASQIEKYYRCSFSYFCRYALNIKEQKKAEVDALEYGSIIHYILENAFKHYDTATLSQMSTQNIRKLVSALLYKYVDENLKGIDKDNERIRFYFQRWIYTASILVKSMADELAKNDFIPTDFELAIAHGGDIDALKLTTDKGITAVLEGKVDRVDVMSTDKDNYFRIIDYKTGIKEFNFSDIKYGINVQMLLYMQAITDTGKQRYNNAKPAGVLYISVTRPIQQIDRSNVKTAKTKSPVQGIVVNSTEVINGMDKELSGSFLPIYSDKNGTLKSRKGFELVSPDEMDIVRTKTISLIADMINNLYDGNTDAIPLQSKDGKFDACKFCEYKSVCTHENSLKRITFTPISKKADIIKALKEENGGENDD